MTNEPIIELELVEVHTNEAHYRLYNPLTHEESRHETADGNIIHRTGPKVATMQPEE